MKKYLLATTLFAIAIFSISNSSGPAAATGRDRTGSPLASGDCSNCHFGGDYGTEVAANLFKDSMVVSEYIPGEEYTFQVSINTSTPAERYGFQAVALSGEADQNAGTFGEVPSGTRITPLNNRDYFEHATKLTTDTIEIAWTAPEAGTGDVRFFAAGNAVNNASGSGGDDSDILDQPLTISEGIASGISQVRQLAIDWQVFPNPAQDQVWIELANASYANLHIRLLNAQGMVLQQQPVDPLSGRFSLSLKEEASGLYFVQLYNAEGVTTKRVFKQD